MKAEAILYDKYDSKALMMAATMSCWILGKVAKVGKLNTLLYKLFLLYIIVILKWSFCLVLIICKKNAFSAELFFEKGRFAEALLLKLNF